MPPTRTSHNRWSGSNALNESGVYDAATADAVSQFRSAFRIGSGGATFDSATAEKLLEVASDDGYKDDGQPVKMRTGPPPPECARKHPAGVVPMRSRRPPHAVGSRSIGGDPLVPMLTLRSADVVFFPRPASARGKLYKIFVPVHRNRSIETWATLSNATGAVLLAFKVHAHGKDTRNLFTNDGNTPTGLMSLVGAPLATCSSQLVEQQHSTRPYRWRARRPPRGEDTFSATVQCPVLRLCLYRTGADVVRALLSIVYTALLKGF